MSEKTLKTVADFVETFRSMPGKLEGFDENNCLTVIHPHLVADGLEAAWKREAAEIEVNAAPLPAVMITSAKRVPQRNCDLFNSVDEARAAYHKEHIPMITFRDTLGDYEVAYSVRLMNALESIFQHEFGKTRIDAWDVRLCDFCAKMTEQKFKVHRNVGRKTVNELKDVLRHYGMEMGREYAAPDITFEEWLFAKVKDGKAK